jgi:hypothetical protein
MEKNFKKKIIKIINGLGDTNYDSILGQIKMIIYFQELLTRKSVTKDELIDMFDKVQIKFNDREVLHEVFGEIGQNLSNSHRCKPVWEDFGESYLLYLLKIMKSLQKDNILLDKCNE